MHDVPEHFGAGGVALDDNGADGSDAVKDDEVAETGDGQALAGLPKDPQRSAEGDLADAKEEQELRSHGEVQREDEEEPDRPRKVGVLGAEAHVGICRELLSGLASELLERRGWATRGCRREIIAICKGEEAVRAASHAGPKGSVVHELVADRMAMMVAATRVGLLRTGPFEAVPRAKGTRARRRDVNGRRRSQLFAPELLGRPWLLFAWPRKEDAQVAGVNARVPPRMLASFGGRHVAIGLRKVGRLGRRRLARTAGGKVDGVRRGADGRQGQELVPLFVVGRLGDGFGRGRYVQAAARG